MYLVTDDLLVEARENKAAVNWMTKSQFFIGLLAVIIFDVAAE